MVQQTNNPEARRSFYVILVQISDTHIDQPDRYVYDRYDTTATLRLAIEVINVMMPQPDLVIHTGDIVCHGTGERYNFFRQLMSQLQAQFRAIPGNHDDRDSFRTAFADTDWLPQDESFTHYVVDDLTVRIICCDSVIAGEVSGEFCPERIAWLETCLCEAPARPTIIAMHHPPFISGMTGSTNKGLLRGGPELASLLRRHPQVVRLIAGHVHRPITTAFAGTIAFAGPTTCYPFGLDMGPERVLRMTGEPPAIAVHVWLHEAGHEGPGLVTHIVPIGDWDKPITLLKNGERVLAEV
jgi:3',5'-cyclic AMP phosphodiesterase CpdA